MKRDQLLDYVKTHSFPHALFYHTNMPGEIGRLLTSLRPISYFPPYPWGQWLYHQVYAARCSSLEGDIIEFGVGRGGMSIFLGHLAKTSAKKVFALDSFQGLPPSLTPMDNPYFKAGDYGRAQNYDEELYDLVLRSIRQHELQDTVIPIRGFFAESVKEIAEDQRFCFAHIDGDLYESVHVALKNIFDRVVEGGVIVIDDFFHPAQGPARAASDYFNERGIYPLYHVSFPYSVFILKGQGADSVDYPRSVDGNSYSFEWLRNDEHFLSALDACIEEMSRDAALLALFKEPIKNAEMLRGVLTTSVPRSSDIYEYWRSLYEFWDTIASMTHKRAQERDPLYA
jgi:hypothetical protein